MNDQLFLEGSIEISDELWMRIAPLLPAQRKKLKKGRPRLNDRLVMATILYKLTSGCSWKALPHPLAASSTVFDRYQEWHRAGVFEQLRQAGILQAENEG